MGALLAQTSCCFPPLKAGWGKWSPYREQVAGAGLLGCGLEQMSEDALAIPP